MAVMLEVIACSVEDALEAQRGGAGRLEIIRDLAHGGLTPPLELVQQIIAAVSIPVRVMLRESEGYEVADEEERQRLCLAAQEFSPLHIDGLVLGFLRGRTVDVELTQRVLACAPSLEATFHHAFEATADPSLSILDIKKIKAVDRILTHGGDGAWSTKVKNLAHYQQQAGPEIEIIAGGGLDAEKIATISSTTVVREFHVGRAARERGEVDGAVTAGRVKNLVDAVKLPTVIG